MVDCHFFSVQHNTIIVGYSVHVYWIGVALFSHHHTEIVHLACFIRKSTLRQILIEKWNSQKAIQQSSLQITAQTA